MAKRKIPAGAGVVAPEANQKSARSASLEQVEGSVTSLDVDALRQIIEILEASDVTRLSWRRGRERLLIRRGQATTTIVHAAPASAAVSPVVESVAPRASTGVAAPTSPAPAEKSGLLVTSPFVGTFYRTPAPDQPPFVDVGAVVKKGQVLCIIEAMKLMNEIEAEAAGRIAEILAENGQIVEFGQPMFRIEPV